MKLVRPEIARVYRSVHTWTGILTGMALFIAFYAGAITVFREPLAVWATPPAAATMEGRAVPLSDAPSLITQTLASQPELAHDFRLRLTRTPEAAGYLEWEEHPEGADDEHDSLSARHYVATLDGGVVRTEEVQRSKIGEVIDVLHRVVGLPVDGDLTRLFMGIVAALYFLALVSGLIILLPSFVKDLFAMRVGPKPRRTWRDAHDVVGLGSLPFHLVMALTATVFAFHDGIYAVQNELVHGGKLAATFAGARADAPPRDPATMLPPAELVSRVTALAPTFEPYMLQYLDATGPKPVVRVWGRDPRGLEFRTLGGVAMLDPYSGRVVTAEYLPGQQSAAGTVLASLFALHFATYGGTPLKWIYFVLGLSGAWLFYSGNLLWIASRRRAAAPGGPVPEQRRDVRLLASATVGVCLGAVCGISLTVVAARWLHGHVADLAYWHRVVYYAAFFVAIGWSFWRGAARASVELLWAAAAVTLAIPVTTLVAVTIPSLGMWANGTPGALGVDAIAFAMAVAFAWMARGAARRVHEGPADSVWSVRSPGPAALAGAGGPVPGEAGLAREQEG